MFSYDQVYLSRHMPVMAKNIVASSQPLAVQAGLRMLLQGGNAVDAALATAISLSVVEPTSNGIGSDAFCIVWDGEALHGLNASGRSPADLSPKHFLGQKTMPLNGWDTVTVPGAVSAWVALSERFGRLPFETLFEPAITYAQEGFLVSPITARAWARAAKRFAGFESFSKGFLPKGKAPKAGELFTYPDQAKSLRTIAKSKGKAFYEGKLAEKMVADAKKHGGVLRLEDLASHQAEWVATLSQSYGAIDLHEVPPNTQGLAALLALGILRVHAINQYQVDSADSLHVQIEAMKLALADANRYIADPESMEVSSQAFLGEDYLMERASLIDLRQAKDPGYGVPDKGGTVYLTAADAKGMMVSFIQSNYYGFGSGIVVPGTGISLQNRAAGFVLEEGHPNEVAGNKRPFHTIIPGFATSKGQALMSFGVMGGPMQAQGHVQMIVRMFDYGQNPQMASDAPRWRVMGGCKLAVEQGFKDDVLNDLISRGHQLHKVKQKEHFSFGGAQLIAKVAGGYVAGSDHRKDGQAAGF